VLVSRRGRVGVIRLNRPEKLNAFFGGMRDELAGALRAAADDDSVGALVITGAGRGFCAGADVAWMYNLVTREEWDTLEALVDSAASVIRLIDGCDKPVLAAVNGVAAGGGACLALACDIRIAGSSASIGLAFARLGLQPDWGGTYVLPRLIGPGRALELVLTADMLSAQEALQIGLFNRVVDDELVVEETVALAERIAARPALSVALARQAIRTTYGLTLSEALERERRNQMRLLRTPEARDAMRAFLEKRRPESST
jgi:2-(1,2-epoxy-1,2-dihydrophenyl)acetyl-CoA isomerase